ncbi:hypothetical protein LH464_08935 [Neorhizobium sp. T786]|uniref:hypothetical protein n=1 Tax=Pseudorhizobium xiangyangii TaxID=2883104 RepID=UPI001CFFF876|nr:hypothetical protein [Neorhizobium xiangyangii]MCB5202603.1 hypothetical protein [Neorhizobium xiangyangii]
MRKQLRALEDGFVDFAAAKAAEGFSLEDAFARYSLGLPLCFAYDTQWAKVRARYGFRIIEKVRIMAYQTYWETSEDHVAARAGVELIAIHPVCDIARRRQRVRALSAHAYVNVYGRPRVSKHFLIFVEGKERSSFYVYPAHDAAIHTAGPHGEFVDRVQIGGSRSVWLR